jgi:hypothetical protein
MGYAGGSRLAGVDVQERLRLVVEGHLDHAKAAVPLVDLALAGTQELHEGRVHVAAHEAEDRVRLVTGPRHRELGAVGLERRAKPCHEVFRKEWRIARGRHHETAAGVSEAALESRERAGEALDLVGDHAVAEALVLVEVAVGVDEELVHLRSQPLDDMRRHGLAAEGLKALVDAPHAAPLAAGEHDPRHLGITRAHATAPRTSRCAPVKSR